MKIIQYLTVAQIKLSYLAVIKEPMLSWFTVIINNLSLPNWNCITRLLHMKLHWFGSIKFPKVKVSLHWRDGRFSKMYANLQSLQLIEFPTVWNFILFSLFALTDLFIQDKSYTFSLTAQVTLKSYMVRTSNKYCIEKNHVCRVNLAVPQN